MSAHALIFYALALLTVGSAGVVVLSRNLIYCAFALLFTFFGVAGLYLQLGADFLAAAQLLIYVGGILVLLLFGVMLTHKLYDLELRTEVHQFAPSAIVCGGLFIMLAFPFSIGPIFGRGPFGPGLAFSTDWALGAGRAPAATTLEIGRLFLSDYLLPFEAASILLLVALIGAAMIVRRKKEA